MSRAIALALIAGCGGGGAVVLGPAPAAGPTRLVVTSARQATFYRLGEAGLVLERQVSLPGVASDVDWVGAEPIVLIEDTLEDGAARMELGAIGELGYRPMAVPAGDVWRIEPPEEHDFFDVPRWRLQVAADGATWLGRCEWGFFGDGDACTEWVYARLAPGALIVGTPGDEPKASLTPAPAAPQVMATLIAAPTDADAAADDDEAAPPPADEDPKLVLECVDTDARGGAYRSVWPDEEARATYKDVDGLDWIATEPPLLRVWAWQDGLDYDRVPVIFEGCAPSSTWAGAEVIPGPAGVSAIHGGYDVAIIVDGRVVDTLALPPSEDGETPGFDTVTFATAP